MFFKKSKQEEIDEAVVKRWVKKMDALITGAILGWVVASLYGVKKIKEANQKKLIHTEEEIEKTTETPQVSPEPEKKKSIFRKFF